MWTAGQQPLPPSSRSAASTRKPPRSRVPPRRQSYRESGRPAGRGLRPPSPSKVADIQRHLAVMQPIPIRSINPSSPAYNSPLAAGCTHRILLYVLLTSCPPLDLTKMEVSARLTPAETTRSAVRVSTFPRNIRRKRHLTCARYQENLDSKPSTQGAPPLMR